MVVQALLLVVTAKAGDPFRGRYRVQEEVGLQRVTSELQGDPDSNGMDPALRSVPPENGVMGGLSSIVVPLGRVTKADVMKRMVAVALSYTPHRVPPPKRRKAVSRDNDPKQVKQFLQLFRSDWHNPNPDIKIKFCAAGISFAACKAFCDLKGIRYSAADPVPRFEDMRATIARYFFTPDPLCANLIYFARKKQTWRPVESIPAANRSSSIKEGYLVLYRFPVKKRGQLVRDRNGRQVYQNHVGIVRAASAAGLSTVEFNTSSQSEANGGCVAEKSRGYGNVYGFIATY